MAASVREQIAEDLKAAQELINGTGDFLTTVQKVSRLASLPQRESNFPHILQFEPVEKYSIGPIESDGGFITVEAVFEFQLFIESDRGSIATDVGQLLQDHQRATMIDPRRGGLALNTVPVSSEPIVVADRAGLVGIATKWQVIYRQNYKDPTIAQ